MKTLLIMSWGYLLSMALRSSVQKWGFCSAVFSLAGVVCVTELPVGAQSWAYTGMFCSSDWFSGSLSIFTCWLMPMVLLAFWPVVFNKSKKPVLLLSIVFILSFFLISCFSTSNMLWFFVCFEGTLLPTGYMIVKWGKSPERRLAFKYLFSYGTIGGLPLLVCSCWLVSQHPDMWLHSVSLCWQFPWEFQLMLMMPGLFKMPVWPFHVWLPKAHVEAPLGGSLLLAGILLKLGAYQIYLFKKQLYLNSLLVSCLVASMSLVGSFYASCVCLRQTDMKSAIAYSSVCHMGVVSATLAFWTPESAGTALAMMLSHGFVSCSLFSVVAVMSDAVGSRSLFYMKGLSRVYPGLGWILLVSLALNGGFPLSAGFLSELFLLAQSSKLCSVLIVPYVLSMVMVGVFSIHVFLETQHGTLGSRVTKKVRSRELFLISCPLACGALTLLAMDGLF